MPIRSRRRESQSGRRRQTTLRTIPLFADGGYTGGALANQAVGVVHGGEFVFSKTAVDRIGLGNLSYEHTRALQGCANSGYVARPDGTYAGGGGNSAGSAVMQLSPVDRALLQAIAAKQTLVVADGRVIAQMVSCANVASSRNV